MDNFYVYAYLREKTTVNGIAGSPYYIGKGHGRRAFTKHSNVPLPKDKTRIIVMMDSLSESQANDEEKRFIKVYGRIDNGRGCLRNRTDGGEGQCGVRLSQERRDEISRRMVGKKYALGWRATEEQKAKLSSALKGKPKPPRTPEHTEKIRQKQLGKKPSLESLEKRSKTMKGRKRPPFSEEWKRHISEALKGKSLPNSGSFQEGITPWNTGTKGVMRANRTSFSAGFTPWNAGKKGVMPEPWSKKVAGTGVLKANSGSFKKGMIPWNKKAQA